MNKSADWAVKVTDLEAAGMAQGRIARAVGLSRTALNDLKTGRSGEPKGMVAVRLHALWKRRARTPKPDG